MKTRNYYRHLLLLVFLCLAGTKTYAYDIAVENEDGVIIYYNIINAGTELEVTYSNTYGGLSMVIPENVLYMNNIYKVTSIGNAAFSESTIKTITLPNTIVSIGNHAFYKCSRLTSITIPNSVTTIGQSAFDGCI